MEAQEKIQGNVNNEDVIIINRRSFFGVLLGIGSAGMGVLLGVPVLRYVLYPLYAKSKQDSWSLVGPMEEFSNLDTPIPKSITVTQIDGWRKVVSPQSVYVTKGPDGNMRVLSSICPHLGCSVGWHKGADEFTCPCHGGRFAPDGKHVFGPPPRGMDNLPHKIQDGNLMVRFEYFRENVPNQEVVG